MGALSAKMNEHGVGVTDVPVPPGGLAGLIALDRRRHDQRTGHQGRLREDVHDRPARPREIVEREGLARIDDESAIVAAVRACSTPIPDRSRSIRAGKQQTFGFLVGQVMKATKGKANPALVNDLLKRLLETGSA